MLEGQNSASPPRLSHERSFLGCETLFDLSGSSVSLPGLLKVVKFFNSLLGFTVSANETLVGDFLGLKDGLLVGRLPGKLEGFPKTAVGVLDGEMDGLLLGLSCGPLLGRMDGLLDGPSIGKRSGSVLGRSDGPS